VIDGGWEGVARRLRTPRYVTNIRASIRNKIAIPAHLYRRPIPAYRK
jgi:hypothetical protein